MTHAMAVAVAYSQKQLVEEDLGRSLAGAAVYFDSVEKLPSVRELHHEKYGALRVL